MAEGTFKLKKLHPPFGTAESPLWEFGYDEEVRVVDGLCEVRSPALRDRLLKMGYEPADEDTPPPASPKRKRKKRAKPTPKEAPKSPTPSTSGDPAAAPEEQPVPPQGGAAG